jgi:transcriptional regulator GlxA family with amidase domain
VTIVIYMYEGTSAMDFVVPYELLRSLEGVDIKVVSDTLEPITLAGRELVVSTKETLVDVAHADVLWVCGGYNGLQKQLEQPPVLHAIYRLAQTAQLTIGIESGVMLLAQCGILKDVKATSLKQHKKALKKSGALWQKAPVIMDQKIVTAMSSGSVINLTFALIAMLFSPKAIESVKEEWDFIPEPPIAKSELPKLGYKAYALQNSLFKEPDSKKIRTEVVFYLFDKMRAMDFAVIYDLIRHFPQTKLHIIADKKGFVEVEGGGFSFKATKAIQEITRAPMLVIGGGEQGIISETTHAYLMHWMEKISPTAQRILTISDGVRYLGVSGVLTQYEPYIDPSAPLTSGKFMMAPCFTMAMDSVLTLAKTQHSKKLATALQCFVAYGYEEGV